MSQFSKKSAKCINPRGMEELEQDPYAWPPLWTLWTFFHLEDMLCPKYLRIHFLLRLSVWSNFGHKYKQHNAWSTVISGKELSDYTRRDYLTDNFI